MDMATYTICELVVEAQRWQEESMLELIERFKPLLYKYSHLLASSDSYEELQCHFISCIHQIPIQEMDPVCDAVLVKYISRSVRNNYISLSKEERKTQYGETYLEDLIGDNPEDYFRWLSTSDAYTAERTFMLDIEQILSQEEYTTVLGLYFHEHSVNKIALQLGKSRQTVYSIRERALAKLRVHLYAG